MKKIITLLFFATLFSCDNNEPIIDSDNLLLGVWLEPVYDGETTTFKRGNSLPKEAYGILFNVNGGFIEKTSGWCGTPPLSFFNIEGTFQLENTLVHISTSSYPNNYAWRIIALTETELVIKREITEQEKEHRELMILFDEISTLSYSISCTNSNDWSFTSYGAKACGGPQGYIAYSNQIDTAAFLQKTATYTEAEKDYNIKWGIVSDCSVPNEPKSVECKNGIIKFNY